MRIAILMYGQPRYASYLQLYNQRRTFLSSEHQYDYFCHMWIPNQRYLASSFGIFEQESQRISRQNAMYPVDNIFKFKKMYNPKVIQQQQQKSERFFIQQISQKLTKEQLNYAINQLYNSVIQDSNSYIFNKAVHPLETRLKTINNSLSQSYSIQKVCRLFEKYRIINNIEYDMVLLTRYDISLQSNILFEQCVNNKLNIPGYYFHMNGRVWHQDTVPDNFKLGYNCIWSIRDNFWLFEVPCLSWLVNIYNDLVDNISDCIDKQYPLAPEQIKTYVFLRTHDIGSLNVNQNCKKHGIFSI